MQAGGFVRTLWKTRKAHADPPLFGFTHCCGIKYQFFRAIQDQLAFCAAFIPVAPCLDQRIAGLCPHDTHIHSDICHDERISQIAVIFKFMRDKAFCTGRTGTPGKKIVSVENLSFLIAEKFYGFLCPFLVKTAAIDLNTLI